MTQPAPQQQYQPQSQPQSQPNYSQPHYKKKRKESWLSELFD